MKRLILISIILLLFACKKYEQGPLISLHSKKGRLIQKWEVQLVFNPDNIVQTFPYTGTIEFKEDYIYEEVSNGDSIIGDWDFSPKKTHVHVYNPGFISYKILKLEKNNLWLLDEVANREYHLTPW